MHPYRPELATAAPVGGCRPCSPRDLGFIAHAQRHPNCPAVAPQSGTRAARGDELLRLSHAMARWLLHPQALPPPPELGRRGRIPPPAGRRALILSHERPGDRRAHRA